MPGIVLVLGIWCNEVVLALLSYYQWVHRVQVSFTPQKPAPTWLRPASREALTYLSAVALTAIVFALAYRVWELDLRIPMYYGQVGWDLYNVLMMTKATCEAGWYYVEPRLGLPGKFEIYDYPLIDTLTFALVRLLSFLNRDFATVFNAYYFLTFQLSCLSTLATARCLGASRPSSLACGLLVAFAPYHIWHGPGHLLQSSYYSVPFAILIAVRLLSGKPLLLHCDASAKIKPAYWSREFWVAIIGISTIALAHGYYVFFGVFLIAFASVQSCLSRPDHRQFADCLAVATLIFLISSVQWAPLVIRGFRHGYNAIPTRRSTLDADLYALRISYLLATPVCERFIGSLEIPPSPLSLGSRDDLLNRCLSMNEAKLTSPLGFVGASGFLVLLLSLGSGPRFSSSPTIPSMAVLNVGTILLANVGGFGALVFKMMDKIRCYSRASIYIYSLSIFALATLFDQVDRSGSIRFRLVRRLFLGLVVALGLLHQVPAVIAPDGALVATRYRDDLEFIRAIERAVPAESAIFQLPVAPYPERGLIHQMDPLDHLRGYLHSTKLRWSFGAMAGRPTAAWQESLEKLSVPSMIKELQRKGFRGVYLNRSGYSPEAATDLILDLSRLLNQRPLFSKNEELVFFRIAAPP